MLAKAPPQLARLRQKVSGAGEGLKCLNVWNVFLFRVLFALDTEPKVEQSFLFLPFPLSFPKATRGQKETSLPPPATPLLFDYTGKGGFFSFYGP